MTEYRRGHRCAECRAANAARVRANRAARRDRLNHGTRSAYDAGCREPCCLWVRVDAYERLEGGHRPHAWRERIKAEFYAAWQSWWSAMERSTFLYPSEIAEYPVRQPTFKAYLMGLSGHAVH